MVSWKVYGGGGGGNRNEDSFLNVLKLTTEGLPKYPNIVTEKDLSFAQKYGDAIRGSVPDGMLKLMFQELTKDSSLSTNNLMTQRY